MSVDLPEPEGPMIAVYWPAGKESVTPRSAWTAACAGIRPPGVWFPSPAGLRADYPARR
jgi:hypothetical protein